MNALGFWLGYHTNRILQGIGDGLTLLFGILEEFWVPILFGAVVLFAIYGCAENRSRKALDNNPPTTQYERTP